MDEPAIRRRTHGRIQRALRLRRRARRRRGLLTVIGSAASASFDSARDPASTSLPQARETASIAALAGTYDATHVSRMQTLTKTELVGFMELQVGSLAVQVPIRSADPVPSLPLVSFEVEGDACAILIRGESSSKAVEKAMGEAAKQAVVHLSRKLLN